LVRFCLITQASPKVVSFSTTAKLQGRDIISRPYERHGRLWGVGLSTLTALPLLVAHHALLVTFPLEIPCPLKL
jgi:hypothetical protein